MALSDEQIDKLMNVRKPYSSAKAIERAVRAQDTALIRQLVEALEGYRRNHNDTQPCDAERAGRARLEGKA